MLCMHELALTRSEPGAKMNTIQPKPDALEVQYHTAQGQLEEPLKGILPREPCILKIFEQMCYLSPRTKTPFSILVWTVITFISWSCHICGLCFYHECTMSVQHVLTSVPGLEVATWAHLRGITGNLQLWEDSKAPLDTHPRRTRGLSAWCLTYFYSALHCTEHRDFCDTDRLYIILPIWQ